MLYILRYRAFLLDTSEDPAGVDRGAQRGADRFDDDLRIAHCRSRSLPVVVAFRANAKVVDPDARKVPRPLP